MSIATYSRTMNRIQRYFRKAEKWLKARDVVDVFNILIPSVVILTAIVYMLQ